MKLKDVVTAIERCQCAISGKIPKDPVYFGNLPVTRGIEIFSANLITKWFNSKSHKTKQLSQMASEGTMVSKKDPIFFHPTHLNRQLTADQAMLFDCQRLVTMLMLAACQAINQNAANAQVGREALWGFTPPKPPTPNVDALNYQPDRIYTYLNGCSQETLNTGVNDLNAYLDTLQRGTGSVSALQPNSVEAPFLTGIEIETIAHLKVAHFIQGKIFVASAKNAAGLTNPLIIATAPSTAMVNAASITASTTSTASNTTTASIPPVSASLPSPSVVIPVPSTTSTTPTVSASQTAQVTPIVQVNSFTTGTLFLSTTPANRDTLATSSSPTQQQPNTLIENKVQNEIDAIEAAIPPSVRNHIAGARVVQQRLVGTLHQLHSAQITLAGSQQTIAILHARIQAEEQAKAKARAAAQAAATPKPKTAEEKLRELRWTISRGGRK